jgi:hypothetical protein
LTRALARPSMSAVKIVEIVRIQTVKF